MRTGVATLSPRAMSLVAAVGVLVYALVLWFAVVSPKRSETARVGEELAAAETRLAEAQAAAHRPQGAGVPVSDVFRLAKAMPSSVDNQHRQPRITRIARIKAKQ